MRSLILLGTVVILLSIADGCRIDPGSCTCMFDEIWCPSTDLDNNVFKLELRPRILIISCHPYKDLAFDDLGFTGLDLSSHGPIDKLIYEYCTIPPSFSNLSSALNISYVKELQLVNNKFHNGTAFRAGQFRGMSSDLQKIKISFRENPLNILTPDMFDGVREQLKLISIATRSAESLPEGIFKSMNSLEILEINDNSLLELSPDVIHDLTSLKRFYLNSRSLEAIPDNLLRMNTALEHVDFYVRNLNSTVSGTLFQELSELKTLNGSGNFFQKCSSQMFLTNSKLERITSKVFYPCRGCKKEVEVPSFAKGTASLKELYINWNRRYNLIMEDDFIEGCSHLEKMTIRKSTMPELPKNVFQNVRTLKSLDLSNNKIRALQDTLFSGLTNLKELNLKDNRLPNISYGVFYDLRSLESLDLSGNQIESIETKAFDSMSRLRTLNLGRNALSFEATEPNWNALTLLKTIDLSNNKIKTKPFNSDLRLNLLSLEEINLSNNLIGPQLDQDILKFHQNKLTLNLKNNQIKKIEPFPSHKNQSIIVHLSGNPIDCNCESLKFHQWSQKSLEERTVVIPDMDRLLCGSPENLAHRSFQKLSGDQFTCPSSYYNVSCPCRQCAFIPYTQTLLLNCSNYQLKSLPKKPPPPIQGYRWIVLDMRNNELTGQLHIPRDYTNNLTELYASSNRLSSLPPTLPKSLQLLHLDHNKMELGNEDVAALMNLPLLSYLSLAHNNFPCNCKSEQLFRFLKTGNNPGLKITDFANISLRNCSIDGALRDVPISEFGDENEFCQEFSTLVIIYALPAIVVLFVMLTFVILSLIYKDKIIVILYQYPAFRQYFIRSDESKNPYDVFISYSHEDQEYVEGRLVNGLESPEDDPLLKYKCLLAVRDFIPGEVISEQIVRAVDSSSRTIIVLSEAFLRSEWAKYEFEIAHSRRKVIVLKIGELPDSDVIGPDLMNYISQNTYLDHDHPNFWRNLRYALPHKGNSKTWRPAWLKPRKTLDQLNLMESLQSKLVPQPNNSLPV